MEKYQMDFLNDYIGLVEDGKISMKERFTPIFYAAEDDMLQLKENIEKVATKKELALLSIFAPTLNNLDVEGAYEYQGIKAKFSIPVKENGVWDLENAESIIRNEVPNPKGVLFLIENPYTQNNQYVRKMILRLMEIFFFEGSVMESDFYIVGAQKLMKELNIHNFSETDSFLHLPIRLKESLNEEEQGICEEIIHLELTPRSYNIGKILHGNLKDKYEVFKMKWILDGCIGYGRGCHVVFGGEEYKDFFKYKTI